MNRDQRRIHEHRGVLLVFFGLVADVQIAIYLTNIFRSAMDTEWKTYWSANHKKSDTPARTARVNFMRGMADTKHTPNAMSEISSQIRARLKQLHRTPGYGWWLDTSVPDVRYDQWALLLFDPNNTETVDEAGYVAIVPTEDRRWAVRFVIADEPDHGLAMNDPLFVCETLQEAKRRINMLLGFDTPEISLFSDY